MSASPAWPSGHFTILASLEDEFGEVYRTVMIDREDPSLADSELFDYAEGKRYICTARCDHKYRARVPDIMF